MFAITMGGRVSGGVNDPYKIFFMVWGASVAGGVGFEPPPQWRYLPQSSPFFSMRAQRMSLLD
jgi:hypothetical protein